MNYKETLEHLQNLSDIELLEIHKQYCDLNIFPDDEIYYNNKLFFKLFFEGNIDEAIRAVLYGEYEYTDRFVKFNGHSNLESFECLKDNIDLEEIAEHIAENEEDYYLE